MKGVDGEAAGEGYSMDGLEQQGSPLCWGGQSSSSSSSLMMPSVPRARGQTEEYREEWASLYQAGLEGYRGGGGGGGEGGAGGGHQQKLDSFSEAFFRRSMARHHGDADGFFGMKEDAGGSDFSDIPLPSLASSFAFPHVLSPPPTPLPAAPVSSPPRRMHHPACPPAGPPGSQH